MAKEITVTQNSVVCKYKSNFHWIAAYHICSFFLVMVLVNLNTRAWQDHKPALNLNANGKTIFSAREKTQMTLLKCKQFFSTYLRIYTRQQREQRWNYMVPTSYMQLSLNIINFVFI